MSDEVRKEAEASTLEGIFEGVQKVADYTAKKVKDLEKKVEDKAAEAIGAVKVLEEKVEKTIGHVQDDLDTTKKRFSVHNLRFDQDATSALKEAVPDRFRKNMGHYGSAVSLPKENLLSQEEFAGATHAWFNMASKLQMRHFAAQHDTLRKEFNDLSERFDTVYKVTMVGNTDTSGGHMVPNIVGNEVLKIIRDASLIYTRARQIPMTSDTLNFPDETTAVVTYWSTDAGLQGVTLTPGEPVLGVKQLLARKLIGRATFSLELLDDSNVAVLPFLQSCFAENMGGELDQEAMEGTGAPFTGVASATSVNDCARTNGTNGITLTYNSTISSRASLVQIFTKAGESYTRNDGIFVMGPDVYAQVIGLVDTNGQPIVRLGTVEGQPNNTLFGRPIIVSARLPKTTIGAGTVSVGSIYFGPPSALLFGVRSGFRWDVTDQVSWSTYAADARMIGRFAYVVGVPTAWSKQTGIIV